LHAEIRSNGADRRRDAQRPLSTRLFKPAGITTARTLCPITDPYVAHHAPLGSLARVHVSDEDGQVRRARGELAALPGRPMTPAEVETFRAQPDWQLALELREIDDQGKVP
jgi:hypothetical protein